MPFIFSSGSISEWRFPATFQVHYRDFCWDYDKNTCFLPFWCDQGHFTLTFFLCHHLSKLSTAEWSAFVQTADITCAQRLLDLYLASQPLHVCCSSPSKSTWTHNASWGRCVMILPSLVVVTVHCKVLLKSSISPKTFTWCLLVLL